MSSIKGVVHVVVLVVVVCLGVTKAQFEDNRCKCVCPGNPVNVTVTTSPAFKCTCEHVMKRTELECLRCECRYEERYTIIIQIVVLFLIVFAGILVLYLVVLLIMDPGMLKRGHSDQSRSGTSAGARHAANESLDASTPSRKQSYIDRVGSAQKRWRRKVIQQRQDVFENRTMLS